MTIARPRPLQVPGAAILAQSLRGFLTLANHYQANPLAKEKHWNFDNHGDRDGDEDENKWPLRVLRMHGGRALKTNGSLWRPHVNDGLCRAPRAIIKPTTMKPITMASKRAVFPNSARHSLRPRRQRSLKSKSIGHAKGNSFCCWYWTYSITATATVTETKSTTLVNNVTRTTTDLWAASSENSNYLEKV